MLLFFISLKAFGSNDETTTSCGLSATNLATSFAIFFSLFLYGFSSIFSLIFPEVFSITVLRSIKSYSFKDFLSLIL